MMGPKNAGKTSIHLVLFANFSPDHLKSQSYTSYINEIDVLFLGHNIRINDCGGQEDFMEHYVRDVPDKVFSNVSFLVYVFDVNLKNEELDLKTYKRIIDSLFQYSKDAKVFILFHKIDKIAQADRTRTFNRAVSLVKDLTPPQALVECFATTIYEQSLYLAWTKIIEFVVPDIAFFNTQLDTIMGLMNCDEILLMEKYTFLIMGSASRKKDPDVARKYEQLSTIIKPFKITCVARSTGLAQTHINTDKYTLIVEKFAENTYLAVIFYNRKVNNELVSLNAKLAVNWLRHNMASKNIKLII